MCWIRRQLLQISDNSYIEDVLNLRAPSWIDTAGFSELRRFAWPEKQQQFQRFAARWMLTTKNRFSCCSQTKLFLNFLAANFSHGGIFKPEAAFEKFRRGSDFFFKPTLKDPRQFLSRPFREERFGAARTLWKFIGPWDFSVLFLASLLFQQRVAKRLLKKKDL